MTFLNPTGGGAPEPEPEPIVSTAAAAKANGGGGPFINWHSLTSVLSSPFRAEEAVARGAGNLLETAGKGALSIPVQFGKQVWDDVANAPHQLSLLGQGRGAEGLANAAHPQGAQVGGSVDEQLAQMGAREPLTAPFLRSLTATGQDVEQEARAAGNRLLPGQPLGDVGDIGSGPGLLGQTDLSKTVARGGGGIGPRLLADVTNLSLLGPPVEALVGGAADEAAAQAATHGEALSAAQAAEKEATKAAAQNVQQAAKQARQIAGELADARRAAASGDPTAAAQVVAKQGAADSAMNALRQAQAAAEQARVEHGANVSLAQQVADTAEGHAEALKGHLATVKLVSKLGSKAAASPFAPVEYGLPIIGKAAHALVGSELGEKFLQPVIDRANAYGEKVQAQREVKALRATDQNQAMDVRAEMERGMGATAEPLPRVEGQVARGPKIPGRDYGLFGTRTVPNLHDPDAFAVLTMAQTGEGELLHGLLGEHLGQSGMETIPREEALAHFRDALAKSKAGEQYTPEQLDLAAEVFGPGDATGKAAAIREALGPAMEAYGRPGGALEVQNREYERFAGEAGVPNVRPEPGEGAVAQMRHNLEGEAPRIEGLQQWQDAQARYDRAKFAGGRRLERAGKALTRAVASLEKTGLSPEELANPRALYGRLYAAPLATARDVVSRVNAWETLAQLPEKGLATVARRVIDGKLSSDLAVQPLADQILRLARQDPSRLSDAANALVADAKARGMTDITPKLGNVSGATAPAVRLGQGAERAQASAASGLAGEAQIVRGQETQGRAAEKMAAPTRARTAAVAAAHDKIVTAAQKLSDLLHRARTATEATEATKAAHPLEAAGMSRDDVANEIINTRRAVAAGLDAEAKAAIQDLADDGVPKMKWPPDKVDRRIMHRSGELKGREILHRGIYDPDYAGDITKISEGGDELGKTSPRRIIDKGKRSGKVQSETYRPDPRFFGPDGRTPDEIAHELGQKAAGAHLSKFEGSGTVEGASDYNAHQGIDEWLDRVKEIRRKERDAGTLPGMTKAQREAIIRAGWEPGSDAAGRIAEALDADWGRQAAEELSRHVVGGDPHAAADVIGGRLNEFASGADVIQEETAARQAKVAAALEADRANEEQRGSTGPRSGRATLDAVGKAEYDRQVAADKAGVQGQILGQRLRQAGAEAAAGAESARTQGRTEGILSGRAQEQQAAGERAVTQAERSGLSAARITGQAPELAQEAAARVAGPVGAMYREAGQREGAVTAALSRYRMEERALERLDEGLAKRQHELEQSVIAAPRAMRPVLQLGKNLRDVLTPLADAADRDYGPGAGDVYRNAAAEATILSAENMRKYGVDPQFLIGQREAAGATGTLRERSGGPVTGATGLRKPGIGLRHATDLRTITHQMVSRAEQGIANATADHIIAGRGGTISDMFEQRGVEGIDEMTAGQLAKELKDAKLVAWRFTDPYGGLEPIKSLTLDTKVVPEVVWKAWQRYAEAPSGAIDTFLKKTYDPATYAMKRIIRITPKWQAAIAAGHSIMAMVGIGADPLTYFGHDVPTALRLNKMSRAGELTAEDAAWIKTLPPDVQAALAKSGFVPGSVINRGFVHEEFLPTEAKRNLVGGRNLKLATSLDNMHRTAVWIHQLEQGLDHTGLADFRAAFPNLAHLTDTEIQNEAAIRLSIRTMGDYLNKTPAERKVWGRIVYFYPWLRHVTKLALNTAVHEPLRAAWLLHVGAMMDGSGGDAPLDFLSSSYDVGGHRWITPTAWNPFDAIVPASDNPLGSFNPIINTGVAALTGHNLRTGKPVTRPSYESGPLSLGEAVNFGANQIPLVQPARESVPALLGQGQPIVRYQTGQPIIAGGRAIPSNENQIPGTNTLLPSWLSPLIPYTGLPQQRLVNTDEIVARQEAAAKRDAKARASYQRRRALLTGG